MGVPVSKVTCSPAFCLRRDARKRATPAQQPSRELGSSKSGAMDGDGDILGMRRRPEPIPQAAGADDPSPSTAAAASRHVTGAGPLKRQRSNAGVSLTKADSERDVVASSGEVPVDQLNPEQLRRYQAWRRSRFERGAVRELILDRAAPTLTRSLESGQSRGVLPETATIAVAAMAKQFVGDVVEEAKRAQLERGESGPLRPSDVLEARHTLAREGRGPPLRLPAPRERGLGDCGGGVRGSGKSLLGGGGVLTKGHAI